MDKCRPHIHRYECKILLNINCRRVGTGLSMHPCPRIYTLYFEEGCSQWALPNQQTEGRPRLPPSSSVIYARQQPRVCTYSLVMHVSEYMPGSAGNTFNSDSQRNSGNLEPELGNRVPPRLHFLCVLLLLLMLLFVDRRLGKRLSQEITLILQTQPHRHRSELCT